MYLIYGSVHIKLSIFENIFSKIKKTVNTFSISEKIFLKMEGLMCTLSKILNILLPLLLFFKILLLHFQDQQQTKLFTV
mgnify:CR=1 FL=1